MEHGALLREVKHDVEERHAQHVLDKAKNRDSSGLAVFYSFVPTNLHDCLSEASKNNPKVSSRRARAVFVELALCPLTHASTFRSLP